MRKMVIALTTALFAVGAYAQQESPIKLKCISEKVVIEKAADGTETEKLVPTDQVLPGDIVQYRLICTNSGTEPAGNVKIGNPVPDNTRYIEGSASTDGMKLLFSADGGKTFVPYADLTVEDGTVGKRPAKAEEITHVQWILIKPLLPEGVKEVTYRVRLE
jgi:uncharacterized repeat protein (TIGR01451 family)